jgi:hypothetical protein
MLKGGSNQKSNAKKPTSYRELDDHVIIERTQPIDSSDTGDEDTVHKRMREDEAEYSPSDNNDEEEYNEDEDELETPTAANADRLHHDDRQCVTSRRREVSTTN